MPGEADREFSRIVDELAAHTNDLFVTTRAQRLKVLFFTIQSTIFARLMHYAGSIVTYMMAIANPEMRKRIEEDMPGLQDIIVGNLEAQNQALNHLSTISQRLAQTLERKEQAEVLLADALGLMTEMKDHLAVVLARGARIEQVATHIEQVATETKALARRATRMAYGLYGIGVLVCIVGGFVYTLYQRPVTQPGIGYGATPVVVGENELCPRETLVFTPTALIRPSITNPDAYRQVRIVRSWRIFGSQAPALLRDGTTRPPVYAYDNNARPGEASQPQAYPVPDFPPNTYEFVTTSAVAGMPNDGYNVVVTVPPGCGP